MIVFTFIWGLCKVRTRSIFVTPQVQMMKPAGGCREKAERGRQVKKFMID